MPARAVGAKRASVDGEDLQRPSGFAWPGRFSWLQRDDGLAVYPHHEGTAVWTRPCLIRAMHAAAMREHGVRVLAEVDDNYLSAPHLNLFMRANASDEATRIGHLRAMSCFDGVVFSTDWLRDRYAKAFRKEIGDVPELHVARNHTLLADWPVRAETDGPLRVGWMGSAQHARDIKLAGQAFAWAKQAGHETVLMGHDVRDTTGVTGRRALEQTQAWAGIITRHIPWVDTTLYHRQALPFDIALAPLELNDHTLGKSDVKAVEYALSGAAPVLQSHPVYAKHWTHNETCLLASSPAEFEHCVRELCRSSALRERLVTAAQQYVREERSDEAAREEWEAAIYG